MSEKKTDKPEQVKAEGKNSEQKASEQKSAAQKSTAPKTTQQTSQGQSERTTKRQETSSANKEAAKSAAASTTGRQSQTKAPARGMLPIYLAVLLVIILLGAALWYVQEMQSDFKNQFEKRLQTQLSSTEQSTQELQTLGQSLERSQSQLKQANNKIATLEDQVHDLSQALQTMTDSGTELMLLNDVAHFIDLAQQQLLVGGNVRNAIIPLETAQARLVRSNRQSLAILLQAINGDLDRLRAVERVDVPDTLKQLETLLTWLTEAPLLAPQEHQLEILKAEGDDQAVSSQLATKDEDQEWWEESLDVAQTWAQRAWTTMRAELAELVAVRRVDDATVLLMTPEQIQGLREHVRLRISMAQLALMTRQDEIWQMELDTLMQLVEKRYDLGNAKTQRALGLLRELQRVDVQPELPSLDNTLAAVENLRQKAAQQADEAEQHEFEAANEMPANSEGESVPANPQDEVDSSDGDNKS
ncbi:MAG TPA: uroporphyrinogen-III C-methyltransferase [Paenalcaligenes sp.]|nr:uroporphyrinogen-III C-methyltransferase [Paenalcaligenes sp.]